MAINLLFVKAYRDADTGKGAEDGGYAAVIQSVPAGSAGVGGRLALRWRKADPIIALPLKNVTVPARVAPAIGGPGTVGD